MFERYTEGGRRVIFMARYFASQTGRTIIETEHLLLGLLREDKGLAQRFLCSPSAAEVVWKRIEQSKPAGEKISGSVDLPLTDGCKRVLKFAVEEAEQLSTRHIGPEHVLLGLLQEEKGFAAVILSEKGIHLGPARQDLIRNPHQYCPRSEYPQDSRPVPQDIADARNRLKDIVRRMEQAVANHDFAAARACSDEERTERENLLALHRQHGIDGQLFD